VFRVVYELMLRGLPEEVECVGRLWATLSSGGMCVGTHTTFVCSLRGCLVKLAPQVVRPQYFQEIPQVGTLRALVEGQDPESLVEVASVVYRTLRECGVLVKLVPE
jgi:hypothetical protein